MNFGRWSPNFAAADAEQEFRTASLAEDTKLSRAALWLGSIASQAFIVNDVRLLWPSAFFFVLLAARAFATGYGFWLLHATRGGRIVPALDRHILLFSATLWLILDLTGASRPAGYLANIVVGLTILFAVFLLLPMRFSYRLVSATVGVAGYLACILGFSYLGPTDAAPILLAFAVATAVGAAACFRIERLRRAAFSQLTVVQTTNRKLLAEVAERQRLATVLEESERNLARLFEIAPIPLAITDVAHGRVVRANQASLDLYRFSTDDLDAVRIADFYVDPADRSRLLALVQRDGRVDDAEIRCKARDGTELWLVTSLRPIAYHEQSCLLSCFYDVSARKAEALALQRAKEAAEAANHAKSDFLAMMSHEIRTPMNGVMGMAQLLAMAPLPEAQRAYAKMILQSADSLLNVVNDVLDFSKIEAGKIELDEAPFAPADLVRGVVQLFDDQAAKKGLALDLTIANEIPAWLTGDAGRVRQVLNNLLGNAVKFTEVGSVSLTLSWEGSRYPPALSIVAADTGIGMSDEVVARLFSPFFQADLSTSRRYGGTGLGLSISKRLVELMGGTIFVGSTVGIGTRFIVVLPLAPGPVSDQKSIVMSRPRRKAPRHAQVLVVEDNLTNQIVVTELLSEFGVEARVAADGAEAIEMLKSSSFGLVFMDGQMPSMDGYETTRLIRAGKAGAAHASVPIVAMTANAMIGERERCLANGMDDYIAKPIAAEDLARQLDRWLPEVEQNSRREQAPA